LVVWQLHEENEDRETRAVRLIGITVFVLAAYLAVESIRDLIGQARPGLSPAGIAVTAAALLVMPSLAAAEHRTGRALGNRTLIADAAESAFCAFTPAAALLGLGLNAWLGWWWADPAAVLVIAALAVKEGREAWEDDQPARTWSCHTPSPGRRARPEPAAGCRNLQITPFGAAPTASPADQDRRSDWRLATGVRRHCQLRR
jgi:hypothetical protein